MGQKYGMGTPSCPPPGCLLLHCDFHLLILPSPCAPRAVFSHCLHFPAQSSPDPVWSLSPSCSCEMTTTPSFLNSTLSCFQHL